MNVHLGFFFICLTWIGNGQLFFTNTTMFPGPYLTDYGVPDIATNGSEFYADLVRKGWVRSDDGLDLRVTRGLGDKGYSKMRVSVVTQGQTSFSGITFEYQKQFQYRWYQNYLYSTLMDIPGGTTKSLYINGNHVNIKNPKQGSGTRGILFGDPCIVYNSCCCKNANNWQNLDKGTNFMNVVMNDDAMDFWYVLGDDFYDVDSTISKSWFHSLTLQAKSKISGAIGGNHDMWIYGNPNDGRSSDQFGIGIMQWYAMDAASSVDNDVFDFSVNPDHPADYHGTPNAVGNTVWWHQTGNVGFIGYNGAYSWSSTQHYFEQACDFFSSADGIEWVFLFGHWNGQNLGCADGMAAQDVFGKMRDDLHQCRSISTKIKFFDGHEHCNWKVGNDGFLIGGNGMYDGSCSQGMFGYVYVKTEDDGHLQVWYFEMINGSRNNWNSILQCITLHGSIDACTSHATLWFDSDPSPGPGPTPAPGDCTPEDADPWVTGSFVECCPNNLRTCLNNWDHDGNYYYLCKSCDYNSCTQTGTCQGSSPSPGGDCCAKNDDPWATGSEQACCSGTKKCLKDWDNNGNWHYLCVSCSTTGCSQEGQCMP